MTSEWLPIKRIEETMLKHDFIKVKARCRNGLLHFKKPKRFSVVHAIFALNGDLARLEDAHFEAHFHSSLHSRRLVEQIRGFLAD